MNLRTIFTELDVSAPAFVAGLAGGSIMLLKYRGISVRRALALVSGSAVASGYLTGIVVHGIGLQDAFIGAIGFGIGISFMMLLDIMVALTKFIAENPKQFFALLASLIPFRKNQKEEFIEENPDEKEKDVEK